MFIPDWEIEKLKNAQSPNFIITFAILLGCNKEDTPKPESISAGWRNKQLPIVNC